jgi:hypothetical protein
VLKDQGLAFSIKQGNVASSPPPVYAFLVRWVPWQLPCVAGHVGKVNVSVGISSVWGEPVNVVLSDVYILLNPLDYVAVRVYSTSTSRCPRCNM